VGWRRQNFGADSDYEDTSLWMIFRAATDTNWMYQACHAAACVTVDSSVAPAADTIYQLRIRATTAGAYTICAAGFDATLSAIAASAGYLSPYYAIN